MRLKFLGHFWIVSLTLRDIRSVSLDNPPPHLAPLADNLLKRSNNFVNVVTKALNSSQTEPTYIRARQEADTADKAYRVAVRKLDRQRLGIEERIEEMLKTCPKHIGNMLQTCFYLS